MPTDRYLYFRNPGCEFRGKPFWAWNGKLKPAELRRQIRVMKRMGLGGFFMHSRVGLATPYLADEWFECVRACIDEAKKQGMEAWLYDEDRWPSGAAGGLVTKNPAYRQRTVVCEKHDHPARMPGGKNVLAAFTAEVSGPSAARVARVRPGRGGVLTRKGESLLVFRRVIPAESSWYNGQTYLDTLNPEAVREFIRVTHEAYRKRIGRDFGRAVPGIFTDEPNFAGFGDAPRRSPAGSFFILPWTDSLPAVFRKRYGYDLVPRLVELVLDVDGAEVSEARWHFHDCVTHLFVDSFARQIGEWCDRAGLAHTGHVLEESPLSGQVHVAGSCMRFYEHMQAPGMDILTERWREYDTAKQVSSAARQFGRKWRLSETYGCSGWDFSFEGQKAVGDWQAALGINLRCQHLAWYTMEGVAKRDYPPCMLHQSPWWEDYSRVEDYFARVHSVMTSGSEVRDLLVVHPVESMWLKCRRGWREDPATRDYDRALVALRDALLAGNLDFDYGDEEILGRRGRVARGSGDGPRLVVGKAEYRAAVVPPLLTIRRSTLAVLRQFRDAGGRVVFAGDAPPAYVDARPSSDASVFAAGCSRAAAEGEELVRSVEDLCRRVSIAGPDGAEIAPALHLLREDSEAFYLFVCNTGHDFRGADGDPRVCDRSLAFPSVTVRGFPGCRGVPVELDPETGKAHRAAARRTPAGWEVATSLPRVGSRLFVFPKRKTSSAPPRRPELKEVRRSRLGGTWRIGLTEANNIVLDRPRFRIAGGKWQGGKEILAIDDAVRDFLKVPRRGGQMVQPWARRPVRNPRRVRVELEYSFDVRVPPGGGVFLAVERPNLFRASVNGKALSSDAECGWWVDRSLRRLPVDAALLRTGRNTISLECDYDETHPGLEAAYLLGDFGAKLNRTHISLTAPPRTLKAGDWGGQGLPFYSGSVAYRKTIRVRPRRGERCFVAVPDYRGVAIRVLVDGREAGGKAWEPTEVEITSLLEGGPAELAIEVIGHRRNSHGPFYLKEKWPPLTGPWSFHDGGHFKTGYQLVPCGLMSPPLLLVRRVVVA